MNKKSHLQEKEAQYRAGKAKWIEGREKLKARATSMGA